MAGPAAAETPKCKTVIKNVGLMLSGALENPVLDADTLVYEFTVSDPATWESSWTAQHEMKLNELPMFEYACHEGNYSMPQMLGGARSIEAREAAGGQ